MNNPYLSSAGLLKSIYADAAVKISPVAYHFSARPCRPPDRVVSPLRGAYTRQTQLSKCSLVLRQSSAQRTTYAVRDRVARAAPQHNSAIW